MVVSVTADHLKYVDIFVDPFQKILLRKSLVCGQVAGNVGQRSLP